MAEQYGVDFVLETDEQWSSVGKKPQPRWLWYAWLPHFKRIVAYALGRRGDSTLQALLERLKLWTVWLYRTDDWGAYQRHLPPHQHLISKRYTQSIERQNLNFRTRIKRLARKTLCFSKAIELHDKIIGEFIKQFHFQI